MSETLRTERAYRAQLKTRLECGCLMTEKDCGLHGPRDAADIMLVSCIFMSEHIRHYGKPPEHVAYVPRPAPVPPPPGAWEKLANELAEVWWWCSNNNANLQHGDLGCDTTYSICLMGGVPGLCTFHADTPVKAMEKAKTRLKQLPQCGKCQKAMYLTPDERQWFCHTCDHTLHAADITMTGPLSPHEERAQLLGASPPAVTDVPRIASKEDALAAGKEVMDQYAGVFEKLAAAPRAEWKPRFAVGDRVIVKSGKVYTVEGFDMENRRYVTSEPGNDIPANWSEDLVSPAPWKLPEPPLNATCQYYKGLGHFHSGPGSGEACPFCAERDATTSLADELKVKLAAAEQRAEEKEQAVIKLWFTALGLQPYPKAWIAANLEHTTKNIVSELSLLHRQLTETWAARDTAESELAASRALVPVWVPIESRLPTEKDGREQFIGGVKMSMVTWADDKFQAIDLWHKKPHWATHWSTPQPLPPLPVETEEAKGREKFEAWAISQGIDLHRHPHREEYYHTRARDTWNGWQAALSTKKDPS